MKLKRLFSTIALFALSGLQTTFAATSDATSAAYEVWTLGGGHSANAVVTRFDPSNGFPLAQFNPNLPVGQDIESLGSDVYVALRNPGSPIDIQRYNSAGEYQETVLSQISTFSKFQLDSNRNIYIRDTRYSPDGSQTIFNTGGFVDSIDADAIGNVFTLRHFVADVGPFPQELVRYNSLGNEEFVLDITTLGTADPNSLTIDEARELAYVAHDFGNVSVYDISNSIEYVGEIITPISGFAFKISYDPTSDHFFISGGGNREYTLDGALVRQYPNLSALNFGVAAVPIPEPNSATIFFLPIAAFFLTRIRRSRKTGYPRTNRQPSC